MVQPLLFFFLSVIVYFEIVCKTMANIHLSDVYFVVITQNGLTSLSFDEGLQGGSQSHQNGLFPTGVQ